MVKADGSVSIHNDVSNKPLNYMKTASMVVTANDVGEEVWTFDARHESLAITLHEIYDRLDVPLLTKDEEPGVTASGTEAQLQQWLFENPEVISPKFVPVQREFRTGAGAVDLLMLDEEDRPVAIEVKRVATLGSVDQTLRYVNSMRELPPLDIIHPIRGTNFLLDFSQTIPLIAAIDLRPKMLELAKKRGLATVVVPKYWRDEPEVEPELETLPA